MYLMLMLPFDFHLGTQARVNMTSSSGKVFMNVQVVAHPCTNLPLSSTPAVVGLHSLKVFPERSLEQYVYFLLITLRYYPSNSNVFVLWRTLLAWSRREEDWNYLHSLWWTFGSCFQGWGFQDSDWWASLCQ